MRCSEIEELKTNKCELGTSVNIDFGNWSEIPHPIREKSPPNMLTYLGLHTYVITRQDKILEIFVLLLI